MNTNTEILKTLFDYLGSTTTDFTHGQGYSVSSGISNPIYNIYAP